jgi:hypothetical protein
MAITCARCGSDRIAYVFARCGDQCSINIIDKEHNGPVPEDMGIGAGNRIEFSYCMGCGQMMGKFPVPPSEMEVGKIQSAEPLDKGLIENLLRGI